MVRSLTELLRSESIVYHRSCFLCMNVLYDIKFINWSAKPWQFSAGRVAAFDSLFADSPLLPLHTVPPTPILVHTRFCMNLTIEESHHGQR